MRTFTRPVGDEYRFKVDGVPPLTCSQIRALSTSCGTAVSRKWAREDPVTAVLRALHPARVFHLTDRDASAFRPWLIPRHIHGFPAVCSPLPMRHLLNFSPVVISAPSASQFRVIRRCQDDSVCLLVATKTAGSRQDQTSSPGAGGMNLRPPVNATYPNCSSPPATGTLLPGLRRNRYAYLVMFSSLINNVLRRNSPRLPGKRRSDNTDVFAAAERHLKNRQVNATKNILRKMKVWCRGNYCPFSDVKADVLRHRLSRTRTKPFGSLGAGTRHRRHQITAGNEVNIAFSAMACFRSSGIAQHGSGSCNASGLRS